MDSLIKMGKKAYKDMSGGKSKNGQGQAMAYHPAYGHQAGVPMGNHAYPGQPMHHPYQQQQMAAQPQGYGQPPAHGYAPQPPPGAPGPGHLYTRQSQHYGSYGTYYNNNVFNLNAWEAYQFQQQSDLQAVFTAEMSKNPENVARQALQAEDLMHVLNNTPSIRNFYKLNWSREMCSIMIAMLDRSQDGFMQWSEFMELQQCLVAWRTVFLQHDADQSGFIDAAELIRVIKQLFGYHIQPQTLETILKRYSRVVPPNGRCIIAFDDFVALSVRLRAYTDAFRKRDSAMHGGAETGNCNFGYDDFLRCVLCL